MGNGVGEEYLSATAAAILRANLLKHDLVQRQSSGGGSGAGGAGGGGPPPGALLPLAGSHNPASLTGNGPAGNLRMPGLGQPFGGSKSHRHFVGAAPS